MAYYKSHKASMRREEIWRIYGIVKNEAGTWAKLTAQASIGIFGAWLFAIAILSL